MADIDGDGKKEIIQGTDLGGLTIWRNTGDNTWQEIWSVGPPDPSGFTTLAVGDHDQDGMAEIIVPDRYVFEIDPADAADMDGDSLVDAIDNCPGVVNPGQEDADIDGVGDFCDNCIYGPNPAQGPAPLGQDIRAISPTIFSWDLPAEVVYAKGNLADVDTYTVDPADILPLGTSLMDASIPNPSEGIFYLLRPNCPLGSWQTTVGAEPGRDAALL